MKKSLLACLLVGAWCSTANAEPRRLSWDPVVDGSITAAGAAGFVTLQGLRNDLAPSECRWCGASGFDRWGRATFAWKDPHAADVASTVLAYGIAPTLMLSLDALAAWHDKTPSYFFIDALLVLESTIIATDITEIVKFGAGRARPYTLDPHEKKSDDNLSFFSGHTSLVFAATTSAATIATMRGYRFAPLLWLVGVPCAMTTGWLRVAADKHWITDVLTGAFVGAAAGALVPLAFHRPIHIGDATIRVAPSGAGAMVIGAF